MFPPLVSPVGTGTPQVSIHGSNILGKISQTFREIFVTHPTQVHSPRIVPKFRPYRSTTGVRSSLDRTGRMNFQNFSPLKYIFESEQNFLVF